MFAVKVVEENFRLLQKVLCLWRKQIFVYIDEDFAINEIRPKFLSLLLTGIARIGVTEKTFREAVHIPFFKGCAEHKTAVNILRLYRAYTGVLRDVPFFSYARAMNGFEMALLA